MNRFVGNLLRFFVYSNIFIAGYAILMIHQTSRLLFHTEPGMILLAFVFFVFAFGLYKIFFLKDNTTINDSLPRWLHIDSIFELKSLLWYSVLTTMVVLFLNFAVVRISANNLSWNFLMVPAGILLISISLFFMKKSEK